MFAECHADKKRADVGDAGRQDTDDDPEQTIRQKAKSDKKIADVGNENGFGQTDCQIESGGC